MRDQLQEIGADAAPLLLEPAGRNTAPAMTLAALQATGEAGADPILVVTPADQTVTEPAAFTTALRFAVHAAADGAFVVLGVTPDRPETGYGYIRCGSAAGNTPARPVLSFVEKPDHDRAARYLAEGGYFWNSGLFVVRASVWLEGAAPPARPTSPPQPKRHGPRAPSTTASCGPARRSFLRSPASRSTTP